MRLLNVKTLEFEEFVGGNEEIPLYAILSHTWGSEEVSYRDHYRKEAPNKKGYEKIKGCCRVAELEGFGYVWIDTCCIDKSSSAELSEAINSMFQWYRQAGICYAYLSDVNSSEDLYKKDSSFQSSRWFTRGWTLQELLAPPEVVFLGSDWTEIGSKRSLRSIVSQITGISVKILEDGRWAEYSVAQKMSWAAGRKTTRLEDEAYCLMGLFDVNMPLLYGEGRRAFWRLQQEILKQSEDQSIFAWSYPPSAHSHIQMSGLIAPSTACFKDSSRIDIMPQHPMQVNETPFEVVNRLVRIKMRLLDEVEALKLKLVKTVPLLYEMQEVKQGRQVADDTRSEALIPTAIHSRGVAEELSNHEPSKGTILPTITLSTSFNDSLPQIISDEDEPDVDPHLEMSESSIAVDHRDYDKERDLSPEPGLEAEQAKWRWYIYEPVIVVPLRCCIGEYQLGILLTRGSVSHAMNGVLSRLHYPSIVVFKTLAEFRLSPLITRYAAISGTPLDDPGYNLGLDRYSWPDLRIAALLEVGYVPFGNSGPNWVLDRSQAAIVHQRKFQYQEDMTNDYAPLVLFSHTSGDDELHPMFFISVLQYVKRGEDSFRGGKMEVEVGTFGPGAIRAAGLEYKLFGFDLAYQRQVDIPLGNGSHVVIKFREAASVSFLTISVEVLRRAAVFSNLMMRDETKTASLQPRLFTIVRSMR